ncbi:acyl carrier protein [Tahibacter sp.]|uniref:acyl carrier protein n=1 Tax=Tahibacter sp. TaxID=2056211 RepID=UPI0028C49397|nr:acyl carrier protein [Tahibacter sp.]
MNKQRIIEIVGAHAAEVLPNLADHRFADDDRLQDLGANSVDRAEILNMVLDSLSLAIPRVELFGPRNIGELADLLLRKLQSA